MGGHHRRFAYVGEIGAMRARKRWRPGDLIVGEGVNYGYGEVRGISTVEGPGGRPLCARRCEAGENPLDITPPVPLLNQRRQDPLL